MGDIRVWRLTEKARKKGAYFTLVTGRGRERAYVALGYLPRREAEVAAERLNEEERLGRARRIEDWLREERDLAIRFLTGDPLAVANTTIDVDYRYYTLRAYFDEIYEVWRPEANPGSWVQERRVWNRILPELGGMRLKDIGPHEVADYLDGLRCLRGPRRGEPVSGAVKRLHRSALQALLKRAYRLRHLDTLPDLAVFRLRGATKSVAEKPDPLTLAELHALLKASGPKHRAMWATAAGQGLRPAELSRVQWEDVDFDGKTLRVRGTKTDLSASRIPLTPLTRAELHRWWQACGQPTDGLAFPNRRGEEYTPQGWRKPLKDAAEAAGIGRRVYPYLLRDSFATIAWLQGIPLELARRVMRHAATSRVLEQVYCRPRPEDMATQLEAYGWGDPDEG